MNLRLINFSLLKDFVSFFVLLAVAVSGFFVAIVYTPSAYAAQAPCGTNTVEFGGVKKLLPQGEQFGRPGNCMKPNKIVLHTTDNSWTKNQQGYDYFASGSEGRGVSSQFIIDPQGEIMQLVEMYSDTAEVAYAVAGYNYEAVSIEIIRSGTFNSKNDAPVAQYNAVYSLVRKLQQTYNIPLGENDYTYQTPTDGHIDVTPGIYGHYQLNPESRSDPGIGFVRDIREDVRQNAPVSGGAVTGTSQTSRTSCVITKVGDPTGSPPPLPAECTVAPGGGSTDPSSCPIVNAKVRCGSLATPINGCGHCGVGYEYKPGEGTCIYVGTQYGIDIGVDGKDLIPLEPIYLPKVDGNIVKWKHIRAESSDGQQEIQGYSGTDTVTQKKYYLQLHHTQVGSGNRNGELDSGTEGGKVWSGGNHVHVQIASGSDLDNNNWLDAAKYFCAQ